MYVNHFVERSWAKSYTAFQKGGGGVQIADRSHLFQELIRDSSPLEVLRGPTGKGDPFERLRIAVHDRRGRRLQSLRYRSGCFEKGRLERAGKARNCQEHSAYSEETHGLTCSTLTCSSGREEEAGFQVMSDRRVHRALGLPTDVLQTRGEWRRIRSQLAGCYVASVALPAVYLRPGVIFIVGTAAEGYEYCNDTSTAVCIRRT